MRRTRRSRPWHCIRWRVNLRLPTFDRRREARARVSRSNARSERPTAAGQVWHQRPSRDAARRQPDRRAHCRDHSGDLRLSRRPIDRRPTLHGHGHARLIGVGAGRCPRSTGGQRRRHHHSARRRVHADAVISRAILVRNRVHSTHRADGIVITPSHNPPEDGGLSTTRRTAVRLTRT